MTILPNAWQNARTPCRAAPAHDAEPSLVRAFATFTQAAVSLEKSYGQLQAEVAQLSGKLDPLLRRVVVLSPAVGPPSIPVQSLGVVR